MLPMPLKPCSRGKVPKSEKKLIPHATETSARKCPESRAVMMPSSHATAPVSASPTTSPSRGEYPALLNSAVA